MFALNKGISIKYGNNKKTLADTLALGNGSVQRVKVEESARHKLVNLRVRTALTGYLLGPEFKRFYFFNFPTNMFLAIQI